MFSLRGHIVPKVLRCLRCPQTVLKGFTILTASEPPDVKQFWMSTKTSVILAHELCPLGWAGSVDQYFSVDECSIKARLTLTNLKCSHYSHYFIIQCFSILTASEPPDVKQFWMSTKTNAILASALKIFPRNIYVVMKNTKFFILKMSYKSSNDLIN